MLEGVEQTARDTIHLVHRIAQLMQEFKQRLRPLLGKNYKHELLNNLFSHPYTKIDFLQKDLMVDRRTVTKYLNKIVETGLLTKMKIGRENYYINDDLLNLFLNHSAQHTTATNAARTSE